MENNTGGTLRIEVPVNDIHDAAPLVIEIPNDAVIKLNGMPIRTELLAMMFTDQNPQRALCEQVKKMQEVIEFQDELIKKYSNRTADLETRLNEYETGMDAYEQEHIKQREKVGLLVSMPLILRACETQAEKAIQLPAIEPIRTEVPETKSTTAVMEFTSTTTKTISQETMSAKKPAVQETSAQGTVPASITLSDTAREYLAKCTEAEASGEGFLGKCLVIDVILNRVESPLFPGTTVTDVVLQHNDATGVWQFSVAGNGMLDAAVPTQETYDAIDHELQCRSYPGLLYFTSEGFSPYGTPWQKIGNHYFSTAK